MKKCPQCGVLYQDYATFCIFCYLPLKILISEYLEISKYGGTTVDFTLLQTLFTNWMESYDDLSHNKVLHVVQNVFERVNRDIWEVILTTIYKHKLLNEENAQWLTNNYYLNLIVTGSLCYDIGIERMYAPIEEVPFYLYYFVLPLQLYLFSHVSSLVDKKCMDIREADKLNLKIKDVVSVAANDLSFLGKSNYKDYRPKHADCDQSKFHVAILKLWMEGKDKWREILSHN